MTSLPTPEIEQAYCTVSALEVGAIRAPLALILDTAGERERTRMPVLAFLLRHSVTGDTLLFDLGIRRDWQGKLSVPVLQRIERLFEVEVSQDVVEALLKGGYEPLQIKYVCLSHIHWDHTGDTALFTDATFIVGEGARELITPGYPADPESSFPSELLPSERTIFLSLSDLNTPIGPFPHALDFFGDGSLYLVDTPGHLPGHIAALVRTSADGGWAFLAGDAAHDWRLITGNAQIADTVHLGCMHRDKEAAKTTMAQIRALCDLSRVRVLLAHDSPWYAENVGGSAFLPGHIETL